VCHSIAGHPTQPAVRCQRVCATSPSGGAASASVLVATVTCRRMTIRVGVFGAAGRMGSMVCQTVADDPELTLVGAVDPHHSGLDLGQACGVDVPGLTVDPDPTAMGDRGVDVVVDFTLAHAARENVAWCAANGVHAVVGTSGFTEDDFADIRKRFTSSNCIVAPNFAIGAVLMMRFAEMAAPFFETAELIELHHDQKVDAPSGTAMNTAQRMAEASGEWAPDPTTNTVVPGARGGKGPGGIPIHSVRLRGLVAHQEVLFGTTGQSLSVRHDSYDRSSFMPGVVLAVKQVADRPGLTVGLDDLLGL
jgi:4-hydroxy-tetrahydrodipicolinate reductase